MSRKPWLAGAASIIIFAFGTASCFAQSKKPATSAACGSGKAITVNLLYPVQPASLDGNYDTIIDFAQVSRNLYDGLFKLDDDMQIQPNLATDYIQLDGLTYEVTLRKGVVFHDGSPFTAADVVSTFDRITNDKQLASKQRTYVSNVNSVTEVGDYKVKFTLKQPDASFIRVLASIINITPKSVINKVGNVKFGKNPVGTGPYKFEMWNQGDSVVLKANCNYWGKKPIPGQVEFRFISEPATQISSLQSGEIDIATHLVPDLAVGLKTSTVVSVQSINSNVSVSLSMNTLKGPFSDQRVRQALNYAVDKDAITKKLLHGYAVPIGQPYAPSAFGYTKEVGPYPYDPERAKKLLKEAGYNGSNPLQVEFVNFRADLNPVWESVASYFSDVGILVKTRFNPNFFADTWVTKKMLPNQIFVMSATNVLMDVDFNLGLYLDGARRGLYFNTPESDAAIAEARGLADVRKRQAAYDKFNAKLHETAPVVFLYSTQETYGTSKRINWKPRADGAIYAAGITKTP